MRAELTQIKPLSQPVAMPPEVATFSPQVEAEIDRHIAKYPVKRSAILPLMFIVQRERGYLDAPAVAYLAERLDLRTTDIWEVATFYSMFNLRPIGKFSLSEVECLGSCGTAPMFQINFDYHENLTPEKVDQIIDTLP